jgi:thiamine kinase-like enzyme
MTFILSYRNIFEYLLERGLCDREDKNTGKIESKNGKNYNLLLSFSNGRQLLVKQERLDREGKAAGDFLREWRIQKFVQEFPQSSYLRPWLPQVLHFDEDNSIIVANYLSDRHNLEEYYNKKNIFPEAISASIGAMLATIHRQTWECQEYKNFFRGQFEDNNRAANLLQRFERVGADVFGQVPPKGLKFLSLYQRFDSLGKAVDNLNQATQPSCLIHNDLKLNNILLPNNWQQANPTASEELKSDRIPLKLIDWENSGWGDPAFDLGMLIANYLATWLGSLYISKSLDIRETLRLATIPLELIQPSNTALICAYLDSFPEIIDRRPDFLPRVLQCSGLALIITILSRLQYQKAFNNTGIFTLQVAKTLLCRPETSIQTVFGIEELKMIRPSYVPA